MTTNTLGNGSLEEQLIIASMELPYLGGTSCYDMIGRTARFSKSTIAFESALRQILFTVFNQGSDVRSNLCKQFILRALDHLDYDYLKTQYAMLYKHENVQ